MKHKVLIADDSLTIQKVIRITLSSEPYNLLDCDDMNQLYKMVESERPALVYLDFTLDEGVSGYDVCKKIITMSPDTKVMMMYGTFDSVDEDLYARSGASGKITKPFDGQKIITLSHQLLDGQSFFGVEGDEQSLEAVEKHLEEVNHELSPETQIVDEAIEITENDIDEDLDWEVNDSAHSVDDKTSVIDMSEFAPEDNHSGEYDYQALISDELKEWGMSVPGEIDGFEPEVISGISNEMSEKVKEMADKVDLQPAVELVEQSQIEDIDDIVEFEDGLDDAPEEILDAVEEIAEVQAVVDEIEPISDEVEEEVESSGFSHNEDGELEADKLIGFDDDNNEDKFSMLESKLTNELDEDNLWDIDETDSDDDKSENMESVVDQVEAAASEEIIAHIDQDDFDSSVEKSVKAYMQEHGREIIEKIAWEMIPDLAENIIREEVKGIASKVLSEE